MSAFTTLINIILEVLATTIRQKEEIKGILIGKEEVKLALFTNDKILQIEKSYRLHQKKTTRTNKFGKVAEYKINIQKTVTNNVLSERELNKTTPCTIVAEIKVPRSKLTKEVKRPVHKGLFKTFKIL